VSTSIVLIGPADALPALRERVDPGAELHTFTEAEALEALDHIIRTKPRIIGLDHEFSSTSRGTALINRIKDDASLADCELRVIAHDNAHKSVPSRRGSGPVTAAVAVDERKPALDHQGTRRATRYRIKEGVELLVDGNTALLVDVSTVGAQVLCPSVLRPNQRVRLTFADPGGAIRCNGSVSWASLELPKGLPPRYRAGIDMTGGDPAAITAFGERHKK
jgi:hypothetical protein